MAGNQEHFRIDHFVSRDYPDELFGDVEALKGVITAQVHNHATQCYLGMFSKVYNEEHDLTPFLTAIRDIYGEDMLMVRSPEYAVAITIAHLQGRIKQLPEGYAEKVIGFHDAETFHAIMSGKPHIDDLILIADLLAEEAETFDTAPLKKMLDSFYLTLTEIQIEVEDKKITKVTDSMSKLFSYKHPMITKCIEEKDPEKWRNLLNETYNSDLLACYYLQLALQIDDDLLENDEDIKEMWKMFVDHIRIFVVERKKAGGNEDVHPVAQEFNNLKEDVAPSNSEFFKGIIERARAQ